MHVLIPARYAASRLPGKPLREVAGKPLIVRVYERAQASGVGPVVVATDDARIADVIKAIGGVVVMTASHHTSGTDRLAEAVSLLGLKDDALVVNLQGDEPLMPPALIHQVAHSLAVTTDWDMATAAHSLASEVEFNNPNVVKVVCDKNRRALYFSRAPIPWPRHAQTISLALRHIGIYAYRVGFLRQFSAWGPESLEVYEGLEQLRALMHGATIGVVATSEAPGLGVDTEEDLARVNALWVE